jgi:hypothetical protein
MLLRRSREFGTQFAFSFSRPVAELLFRHRRRELFRTAWEAPSGMKFRRRGRQGLRPADHLHVTCSKEAFT